MIYLKRLIFLVLIVTSCQSIGQLKFEADINNALTEVSAVETTRQSDLLWVIEDAGNSNTLFGLNAEGSIIKSIYISNAKNEDWEDLTTDNQGNIYIGDFGNNNEKRKKFQIYKVHHDELDKASATAEIIEFTMPKDEDSKDFEAFFLHKNHFYIFSKEPKTFRVLKVKNEIGTQRAKLHTEHNLNGKDNKITSADISEDGKTIVLLNHDKLWKLSDFKADDFFSGKIEEQNFDHNSQKEGVCFNTKKKVLITDERNGSEGGNIYRFNLD